VLSTPHPMVHALVHTKLPCSMRHSGVDSAYQLIKKRERTPRSLPSMHGTFVTACLACLTPGVHSLTAHATGSMRDVGWYRYHQLQAEVVFASSLAADSSTSASAGGAFAARPLFSSQSMQYDSSTVSTAISVTDMKAPAPTPPAIPHVPELQAFRMELAAVVGLVDAVGFHVLCSRVLYSSRVSLRRLELRVAPEDCIHRDAEGAHTSV
jgi:hypothetical protein